MTDTLVVIQAAAAELSKSDLSAAGFGSQAASAAGGAYDILLLGPMASSLSSTAAGLGARTVFTMSSGELEAYTAEAYASAVEAFLLAPGRRGDQLLHEGIFSTPGGAP